MDEPCRGFCSGAPWDVSIKSYCWLYVGPQHVVWRVEHARWRNEHAHVSSDKDVLTTLTWLALTAVGVGVSFLPERFASAVMQAPPPDVVHITGTIRDFEKDHVDFNVVPIGGSGHYAGSIALQLGADNRPVFVGNGSKVVSQWRDSAWRPIAPHLFGGSSGPGGTTVSLVSSPTIIDSDPDTYNSSLGPYDSQTPGPPPTFLLDSHMPSVAQPTGLPPLVDQVLYIVGGATSIIDSDLHCNTFLMDNHHKVDISGNVTILVEQNFTMRDHSRLNLLPGATLTLYLKGIGLVDSFADLNEDAFDPSRLIIYNLGTTDFVIQDHGEAHVTLISPNTRLFMQTRGKFYGRFVGQTVHLQDSAKFHIDINTDAPSMEVCGVAINDSLGTAGVSSTGGISSSGTFDEWYRDVLGNNLSIPHTIDLVRNGGGIYEFLSDEFYPINGQLFGNEGDAHNNYFTFTFTADFAYAACAGQFFEFMGSDDAWLFVDRDMAIDLGGIIPGTDQHVDMDRLNLVDGQTYTMHFFYAQRNPTQAVFNVRTNVPLIGTNPQTVNAGFD